MYKCIFSFIDIIHAFINTFNKHVYYVPITLYSLFVHNLKYYFIAALQ